MTPCLRRSRIVLVVLLLALGAGRPATSFGQLSQRVLPDRRLLPQLVADPREPTTLARFVYVADSPSLGGTGLQGEAGFGAGIPIYRLAGTSDEKALIVGVQGGVSGRFLLRERNRDLVATDWIFAVPVVLHRGRHWFRVRFFHTSAHLGDEYMERFEVERVDYNRDSGELLAFFRLGAGLGLYAGGGYAFNVDPDGAPRWSTQFGAQVEGPRLTPYVRLYGAVDVRLDEDRSWTPRINGQTGFLLRAIGRRDVRLAVEFLAGPSPQGQFSTQHTTMMTLGVYVDL